MPSPFRPVPDTALDQHILACVPGSYPWDAWKAKALAAGLSEELAWLGRGLMREAYCHAWSKRLCRECGWSDEGAALLQRALADPVKAGKRWNLLLATDGGNYPEGAEVGGQSSEAGGQSSEAGGQSSEAGGPRSEAGGR